MDPKIEVKDVLDSLQCLRVAHGSTAQAYRNGVRVGDLRNADRFAEKMRNLSLDGSKRFGKAWTYDVEADIDSYTEIAQKVHAISKVNAQKQNRGQDLSTVLFVKSL